jgi:glycosyltransferase involved in cell wall biosynthesis
MNLSVIVTTYNRPDALACVLMSLAGQNLPPSEILVADDGSAAATAACVRDWQQRLPCPLHHVWQPDDGFRAAMARNRAAAQASGDYLVFIDGDCMVFPDFTERHRALAESGWFVAGNRLLLDAELTRSTLHGEADPVSWPAWRWLVARGQGRVNRLAPLLRLPGGSWRKHRAGQWRGVRTCNLGLWRRDLLSVNGFDESFAGWGHEDADLAVRLIRSGVKRKDGQFSVPVLHLWHQENPRALEGENYARLMATLNGERDTRSPQGIDQYLPHA